MEAVQRGKERAAAYAGPVDTDLDTLVPHWLTVPELCERLRLDAGKVRRLLEDSWLVGVRRGERQVLHVPADFLLPPTGDGPWTVLSSLRGTVILLLDAGLSEAEVVAWLFTPLPELGSTPLEALRAGHKAPVRRAAQALF